MGKQISNDELVFSKCDILTEICLNFDAATGVLKLHTNKISETLNLQFKISILDRDGVMSETKNY